MTKTLTFQAALTIEIEKIGDQDVSLTINGDKSRMYLVREGEILRTAITVTADEA